MIVISERYFFLYLSLATCSPMYHIKLITAGNSNLTWNSFLSGHCLKLPHGKIMATLEW